MAYFRTFDPLSNVITLGAITIGGYADGTFITISRESDGYTDEAGAGGDVVRTRSRDKRATVTITLQAASPSNDALSAIAVLDEETPLPFNTTKAFEMREVGGSTVAGGPEAWVMKVPDIERAKEAGTVEWRIRVASCRMKVGGLVASL